MTLSSWLRDAAIFTAIFLFALNFGNVLRWHLEPSPAPYCAGTMVTSEPFVRATYVGTDEPLPASVLFSVGSSR